MCAPVVSTLSTGGQRVPGVRRSRPIASPQVSIYETGRTKEGENQRRVPGPPENQEIVSRWFLKMRGQDAFRLDINMQY